MMARPPVSGVILAGGAGQRLGGVRKQDIRLANTPLLEWTRRALQNQVDTIVLSVAKRETRIGNAPGIRLPDDDGGVTGPAAGLLAGAQWTKGLGTGSIMLTVSVDTPFFPVDFVERALPHLTGTAGCVVAGYGDRDYPTNALWRTDFLLDMLASEPAAAKGPRLRDVAARLGKCVCRYDHLPGNPFAGINTLRDLLSLSARLRDDEQSD